MIEEALVRRLQLSSTCRMAIQTLWAQRHTTDGARSMIGVLVAHIRRLEAS